MQHGFIKVCAATPESKVADVEFNTKKIIEAAKESYENGSQLTVFPELCICGGTCGDLFNQTALIAACEDGVAKIAKASKGIKTLIFVGAPVSVGGRLYDCAIVIYDGKALCAVPKTNLPEYGGLVSKRNFFSAKNGKISIISYAGERLEFGKSIILQAENNIRFTVGAEICEDMCLPTSPAVNLAKAGANIIVNLSCCAEIVGGAEYRKDLVKVCSKTLACGYVLSNAGEGESTTDSVCAGRNIIAENGKILSESKLFENGLTYSEIDVEILELERKKRGEIFGNFEEEFFIKKFTSEERELPLSRPISKTPFIPTIGLSERCELILNIQQKGLEKRLKHINAKTAVVGVSGGLDSALALLVTCRAFKSQKKDFKDIIAVTMPCFGTTEKTKDNSLKLIKALGIAAKIVPISDTVLSHFKDLGHDPDLRNTTFENAQARMRTMVLMDIANDAGGLVVGTGDLSEGALGWSTYNGDHMSMYDVNGSVPKTLIKHIISYEAGNLGGAAKKVLEDVLATEISPELLPPDKSGKIAQKTEEIVGPYELVDFFVYYVLRYGFAPDKVLYLAAVAFKGVYDIKFIKKYLQGFYKRFLQNQFKRSCMPDGVKVGAVSLSPRGDLCMPSDAEVKVWLDYFE